MRTYEQDLKELNISTEEFDNIISHIYDNVFKESHFNKHCRAS